MAYNVSNLPYFLAWVVLLDRSTRIPCLLGDFKLGKEATEITVKGLNSTAWPGQLIAKR